MKNLKGVLLISLAAVCYGVMPIFTRIAYANHAGIGQTLFLRFLIAVLLYFIMLVFSDGLDKLRISRQGLLAAFIAGALFGATSITFYQALYILPVSKAEILYFTYPVVVMVLSTVFYKEKTTIRKLLCVLILFTGIVFVVKGDEGSVPLRGIFMAVLASVFYALYILLCTHPVVRAMDKRAFTFYTLCVLTGIFLAAAAKMEGLRFQISANGYIAIVVIAVFCTLIALTSFSMGAQYLTPTHIAVVASIEPIVTIISGDIFLKEAFTLNSMIGSGMIVLSIIFINRSQIREKV
jgi:drug/metabolite transporter (DMT)-like permease